MLNLTPEQWTKVILAIIALLTALITAVFTISKRSHKIRDITVNNNSTLNGDNNK